MPDRRLDFYFDYISPFAYIASELLDALAQRHRVALEWKPIDMLRLSNFSGGLPYSAGKRAYVAVDAARSAEFHGLPLQLPDPFPVPSRLALRVAVAARGTACFRPLQTAVFRAAWTERRDIGSENVLAECIVAAGGQPEPLLARAKTVEVEAALATLTAEAEATGVFGVPTTVLDRELFWGVDSLPVLEWRLRR